MSSHQDDTKAFYAELTITTGREQEVAQPTAEVSLGNVGVCLSGGGSRALTAGMGQLRALKYLEINGRSLLSQVKALSTVSGGSWVGAAFAYLKDVSDDEYLNLYVPDQSRLVPTTAEGYAEAETLDALPDGNIGARVNTPLMSIPGLALQAYLLYRYGNCPANMLWQTLIGLNILADYGLYDSLKRDGYRPTTFFTYDQSTLDAIMKVNPHLDARQARLLVHEGDGARTHRPYLICNTAMFLQSPDADGNAYQYLAPVQGTPLFTGILGRPEGTDANGREVGGGGVTSFAFSSNLEQVTPANDCVTVTQSRQWSLADLIGCSSVAYAEVLENMFADWRENRGRFEATLEAYQEEIQRWAGQRLPETSQPHVQAFVARREHVDGGMTVMEVLERLRGLIPEYQYWPVAKATPSETTAPTRFADGGSLENTGIGGMLVYQDIDAIISCINSSTPMTLGATGMLDADGNEIPGTAIIVDSQLPPLFGYQPYDARVGYKLYAGDPSPRARNSRHNQVFAAKAFATLLKGLWQTSGNEDEPGSNATPALFTQILDVERNDWFGIRGGKRVTITWIYTNRVRAWYEMLRPEVRDILGPFDDPESYHNFPYYSTASTALDATQVNLLANLAAWSLVVKAEEVKKLFTSGMSRPR